MSMLRFYPDSWLIQHHAASRDGYGEAGVSVLDEAGRFTNDVHLHPGARMDYLMCYFRPENRFPARVFGNVARDIADPKGSSVDAFAYLRLPGPAPSAPEGFHLFPARPEDLAELRRWYEGRSGGLTLDALRGSHSEEHPPVLVFPEDYLDRYSVPYEKKYKLWVLDTAFSDGYFEAILSGFNSRKPRIEHPECAFKGGKACRYRISWDDSFSVVLRAARLGLLAACVPILGAAAGYRGGEEFLVTLGGLSVVLLALTVAKEQVQFRELNAVIEHQRLTTERSFEDFERVYNNALMGKEIGHVLSASTDIDRMLEKVMEILSQRGDYDRGIILLADEEKRSLVFRAGFGYTEELYREVRAARFSLFKPDSRGVFVLCYRERRPFLVNDVSVIESELSPHSLDFLRRLGSKSFICCPILFEDQCLGVLAVDNLQSKRPLLESDINLLMGIAPEIGLTLNSAFFAGERERQFRSILRTLAASIDARDSLTAGHSERVTEYAVTICEELNMPGEFTDVIRVAAQLHDYGKIGIKDSILKKSGPLTGKQREEIKTHVVKTQDILSRINFSGAYQQVPFIAGSHHERLDGTGYPRGLRPLFRVRRVPRSPPGASGPSCTRPPPAGDRR